MKSQDDIAWSGDSFILSKMHKNNYNKTNNEVHSVGEATLQRPRIFI